jgi:hypothetical protein
MGGRDQLVIETDDKQRRHCELRDDIFALPLVSKEARDAKVDVFSLKMVANITQ